MKRNNKFIPLGAGQIPHNKYAITEMKKAELDSLTIKVLNAEGEVEQKQAIVEALTEKLNKFQGFLAEAEANRTQTLSNKNLIDEVIQDAGNLLNNSEIAFNEVAAADEITQKVATNISEVINKLIFSVEVINKLADLVIRKKAVNPLISDELVTLVSTAGKDANNAVDLTLTALQTTYLSRGVSGEAKAASALEYTQAKDCYVSLTSGDHSLQKLLHQAYANAVELFAKLQIATEELTQELNQAIKALNEAEVLLKSLQAKLAAATAAALAS